MSLEQFSKTVSKIHAAAIDPAGWEPALRAMEELTGSVAATLNLVPTDGGHGAVLAGRMTIEQCAEYARDYMAICPRTAWVKAHPGADHVVDAMVMTEAEMDRDPVYAWFGQQGLRYFVGSVLPPIRGYAPNISLQRSRAQGHVQADDLRLFLLLREHVAQAVVTARAIGLLGASERASRGLFDRLAQAVLLVDRTGRLLFANAAADRLLAAADVVMLAAGAPRLRDRRGQDLLARLLIAAARPTPGHSPGGWMQADRGDGTPPLALLVTPLVAAGATDLSGDAVAMIVIHDPGALGPVSIDMLRDLFGLTPTEARLASLLAEGRDIGSAARLLGQAEGTARVHLKSVFRKLGVVRQAELTGLLAGLASVPGATPQPVGAAEPIGPMSAGSCRE